MARPAATLGRLACGGLLALSVSGCATFGEQATLKPGARIGVANLMSASLRHYHTGITAFNNLNKAYSTPVDYPQWVAEKFVGAARGQARFEFVDLQVPKDLRGAAGGVFRSFPLSGPKVEITDFAREVAAAQRLDLVVVIGESCGPVPPPRSLEMCGYGMYTERAPFGDVRAFAYFDVHFLRITPDGELLRPVSTLRPSQGYTQLKSELEPKDLDAVTPEEMAAIDAFIRDIAARRIEDAVSLLVGKEK